jgi:hypothetical protein
MVLGRLFQTIFEVLFEGLVNCIATVCAAVLNHPAVENAIANGIVAGMNAFLRQPDLDDHVKIMSETLSRNQRQLARNAGEDFPVLVGNFFEGIFKPRRDKDGNVIPVPQPTTSTSTTGTANANANANANDQSSLAGKSVTSTNKIMESPPLSPCSTKTLSNEEGEDEGGLRKRSSRASLAMFGLTKS